ncbi:MAG: RHS repeat domain-containing protein [Christensenellales bacterium]
MPGAEKEMYVKQLIFKKLKKRSSCLRIIQNENRNFYTACVSEPPLEDRKRSYENRPVSFRNDATDTLVECAYDYRGRRCTKKVTVAGTVTLHQRYIYREYLQIACVDLTRAAHPALWFVLWDPTQPTATRPLAIQKDGSWFTYGHDVTKNVWEIFGPSGYVRTSYDYAPFGAVSATGDVTQPFQWSSEFYDSELALVYYNYRHYSPTDGRWLSRDPIEEQGGRNLYAIIGNNVSKETDSLGKNLIEDSYEEFEFEFYSQQDLNLCNSYKYGSLLIDNSFVPDDIRKYFPDNQIWNVDFPLENCPQKPTVTAGIYIFGKFGIEIDNSNSSPSPHIGFPENPLFPPPDPDDYHRFKYQSSNVTVIQIGIRIIF